MTDLHSRLWPNVFKCVPIKGALMKLDDVLGAKRLKLNELDYGGAELIEMAPL